MAVEEKSVAVIGPNAPVFARQLTQVSLLEAEINQLKEEIARSRTGLFKRSSIPADQLRVYQDRIANLNVEVRGIEATQKARDLAFQPYTPPCDWFVGLADPERVFDIEGRRRLQDVALYFNAPIPTEVLKKWQEAKKLNIFDEFLIAGPDRNLFTHIPRQRPVSLWVDPVLIGCIGMKPNASVSSLYRQWGGDATRIGPGILIEGFSTFLVAYWDLEKDLEFMAGQH